MPDPTVVDVHHHWMPRNHFDHPEPHLHQEQVVREPGRIRIVDGGIQRFAPREICCDLSQQDRDMDRCGVDMAVLHLGCWQEWMTMKSAPAVNDAMAEEISSFPNRFIGLAHVPPLESGALEELERAVKRLAFRGAGITSSIHGIPLDSGELEPFYRKVCDLGIPVVVHPISAPMADEGLKDFHLTRSLGRVFEMALTTTRLLHSGILGKFPGLRFVISHLG
ncbi:MAG: amidohydrolase family protein, partial [Armatimonadetes bacterium]|nr:amidohydrolase family protein [Armatimonadota bacterium]